MTLNPSAWERGPSYRQHVVEPLGSVINRLGQGFAHTLPARFFRNGVKAVLDQAWWDAHFGRAPARGPDERIRQAGAVKARLTNDSQRVDAERLRSLEIGNGLLPEVVLCQTLLGITVYERLASHNLPHHDLMSNCGETYGTLLKSLVVPNEAMRASSDLTYFKGKPMSTTFEGPPIQLDSLAHRQTVGDPSVFVPISRQVVERW